MNENIFDKLDFGPFRSLIDNDDITDISYDNNGQIWIRSLTQGSMRVEVEGATPEFVEKLAFQCSNVMGTTFNNAKPFLDAESAELRMNFVHHSIATNGIALVIRKTPAKIRLEKEKLIKEDYFTPAIHDLLIKCVEAHCNIMVAGETGSGKTEFVKYLASHTITNEKIITIEDTLELHLDKIFPQRDIVAMKTNNVASYTDVLVTCMRQNPKWILLSEVRSAEAVSAVRNSISSGHNILSTIHADKASAIPYRLYSLMETDLDVHQFLSTIYRYIQIGVHIRAFYSKEYGQFHREVDEVTEFYVDENNEPVSRTIYKKQFGKIMMCKPSDHLREYIANQNVDIEEIIKDLPDEFPLTEASDDEPSDGENEGGVEVLNEKVVDEKVDDKVVEKVPEEIVEPVEDKQEEVITNPNEGMPGAKPDEELVIVPGADLGHEESIPNINADGNVPLCTPVVSSFGDLLSDGSSNPSDVGGDLITGGQSIITSDENNSVQINNDLVAPSQPIDVQTMSVGNVVQGDVPLTMDSTVNPVPVESQPMMDNMVQGEVPLTTDPTVNPVPVESQPMIDNMVQGEVPLTIDPTVNPVPVESQPVGDNMVQGEVPLTIDPTVNPVPVESQPVGDNMVQGEVPLTMDSAVSPVPVESQPMMDNMVQGDVPLTIDPTVNPAPVEGQPVMDNMVQGEVPLTIDPAVPVPAEGQPALVDNISQTEAVTSVPVLDNSAAQSTEVLRDIPALNVSPVEGQVVGGDVLVQGEVPANVPALDNSVTQGTETLGTIPTLNVAPVEGQPVGDTLVQGEVPASVPALDNSVTQGTETLGTIPTLNVAPVEGQPVGDTLVQGEVPASVPALDNSVTQGTETFGTIPTLNVVPVEGQPMTGDVSLQGTVPSQGVVDSNVLPASGLPATGGPVIPNIVKLDQ